jgi:hypothetical protein
LGWFAWRQDDVVAGGKVADVVLRRAGIHDERQAVAWLPGQDDVLFFLDKRHLYPTLN